jgi:NTP pyrophosphatase (non-canonical NTP hydrolase)
MTEIQDHELSEDLALQGSAINIMVDECHGRSVRAGWYHDLKSGDPINRNVGEMLALVHSEVSEALEAQRKNLNDSHLPDRKGIEVELADALIRILDLCGYLKLDLGGAYVAKLLYNAQRADHKPEARANGGKAF